MGNFLGKLLHTFELKLRRAVTEIQYPILSTGQLLTEWLLQTQKRH